jgi:hypothetical protein
MTAAGIKEMLPGNWVSIAPEIRPSIKKDANGNMKPFYLTRNFIYRPGDIFELDVINSADPYGQIPIVRIYIKGHMQWQGEHPISPGAQKVDFIADEAYQVTPLYPAFADAMNQLASIGFNRWDVGQTQSVMGKAFAPFGLSEGQTFQEYDLVYLLDNMLFWGARNVDGRGFDKPENRPTNLQIPLIRK